MARMKSANEDQQKQLLIDLEWLLQSEGSWAAASRKITTATGRKLGGEMLGRYRRYLVGDDTGQRQEPTERSALLVREAVEKIQSQASVVYTPNKPRSPGSTGSGAITCTEEALRHFEKGFSSLQRASESAMPIARLGFAHVEKEMRKLIETYLLPLTR